MVDNVLMYRMAISIVGACIVTRITRLWVLATMECPMGAQMTAYPGVNTRITSWRISTCMCAVPRRDECHSQQEL